MKTPENLLPPLGSGDETAVAELLERHLPRSVATVSLLVSGVHLRHEASGGSGDQSHD
jgi:hypothetical protein